MFEIHYLTTFILDLTTFNLNVKLILTELLHNQYNRDKNIWI